MFTANLPGLPPTINHWYGRSGGRVFKTEEAWEWQEETTGLMSEAWGDKPPYEGRAKLVIEFASKSRRKWDIDNRIKPLQDCLESAGIIRNDEQIDMLVVKRTYGEQDTTTITLLELEK